MAVTRVKGLQVDDGTISRDDIDILTSGKSLITKVLAGTGLSIVGYTGADPGTGDVTLGLANPQIAGSGANGQVTFWTGANTQAGNASFIWNNSSNRLGVNIASPGYTLDVGGNGRFTGALALNGNMSMTGSISSVNLMSLNPVFNSVGNLTMTGLSVNPVITIDTNDVTNVYARFTLPKVDNSAFNITNFYGDYNRVDFAANYSGTVNLIRLYHANSPVVSGAAT